MRERYGPSIIFHELGKVVCALGADGHLREAQGRERTPPSQADTRIYITHEAYLPPPPTQNVSGVSIF